MSLFQRVLAGIRDFFESLFAASSPEYSKKRQLRALAASIRAIDPPIFRQDGRLLPAFPATLYQINQFLSAIRETLSGTISNQDRRIADRTRDCLIELAMTEDQRRERKAFTMAERLAAMVAKTMPPERLIEEQGKQFATFIRGIDGPQAHQINAMLARLDALADFCDFDFNSLFSFFDPAFRTHAGQETTVETPSFQPVEVVEVVPILLDLYYLLGPLDLSQPVVDVLSLLEAKRAGTDLNEEITGRMARVAQAIVWLLQKRMSKDILLAVIRLVKEDPAYVPQLPQRNNDYVAQYRERLTEIFHSDSRKILKEREEDEIDGLVRAAFGDRHLERIEGYSEETNALLQEFTVHSLEWIKPLQIIRTFATYYFEPHFRGILRSVIVEGYFNNRTLQSSLSTAYYFCESVSAKLREFENLFADGQPCSLKVLTGYLTELEKGMDFEKPLRKMVENMNAHAKDFVQQAVNNYADVYAFSLNLMEDNKKSVPEYVTNIRNLSSSSKNMDSFAWLERESGVFRNFLEIMKKYAIVGMLPTATSGAGKTEN